MPSLVWFGYCIQLSMCFSNNNKKRWKIVFTEWSVSRGCRPTVSYLDDFPDDLWVCPVFPCTLEKPAGMSLYSVWTLLGTCHNLGPSGISGRYIQETTLKFSTSRGQFLLHGIRLWSDSILVSLCSLPQSETTSNWLTTDTWEPSPFWELFGEYFTSSAIHSWVTWLSY